MAIKLTAYDSIEELIDETLILLCSYRNLLEEQEYEEIITDDIENELYVRLSAINSDAIMLFCDHCDSIRNDGYVDENFDVYYDAISRIIDSLEVEYDYRSTLRNSLDEEFDLSSSQRGGLDDSYYSKDMQPCVDLNDYNSSEYSYRSYDIHIASFMIRDYIKTVNRPVEREEIESHIQRVTEKTNAAINEANLLKYDDLYYLPSLLIVDDFTKKSLYKFLVALTSDNRWHESSEVFDALMDTNANLLSQNYIINERRLMSFLRELYPNNFVYRVTRFGNRKAELYSRLVGHDQDGIIDVNECISDMKMNSLGKSVLILFDLLKNDYMLYSKNYLVRNSLLGLTVSDFGNIIWLIRQELKDSGSKQIKDLECIKLFPDSNIGWNQWLIYSIVVQYGNNVYTECRIREKDTTMIVSLSPITEDFSPQRKYFSVDDETEIDINEYDDEIDIIMKEIMENCE